MLVVFPLLVALVVLACLPAWAYARRRQGASWLLLCLGVPAILVWVALAALGAELEIAGGGSRMKMTLVAGLVARRIVPWVESGDAVGVAQRIGLIRFGSRVDLELPGEARLAVRVGDKVVAGVTVLARVGAGAADGRSQANPV